MAPTCQSLPLSSPCCAQRTVWREELSRSRAWPSRSVAACSGVGDVAKSNTPPSRARHLPHFPLRLVFLFSSSLGSPLTALGAARARRPISRVSSHGFQIHRTRSSLTSLASFPTPPNLAPSLISPGTEGFPAAIH